MVEYRTNAHTIFVFILQHIQLVFAHFLWQQNAKMFLIMFNNINHTQTFSNKCVNQFFIPSMIIRDDRSVASGNSFRKVPRKSESSHNRRASRLNLIEGVKIPSRRFCNIGLDNISRKFE